jgi:hypothetical protein
MADDWAPIPVNNNYSITRDGRVKNAKGKLLQLKPDAFGYITIGLWKKQRMQSHRLHRLVAMTFLENPKNLPVVHHRNGNKTNNKVENLEWASYSTNRREQLVTQLPKKGRSVTQVTLDGTTIKTWNSLSEAAKAVKTPVTNISSVCQGKTVTAAGFKWHYTSHADENKNEEWKHSEIKGCNMEISNYGRVQRQSGRITTGVRRGNYLYVSGYAVHRLVATAFCPKLNAAANEVNHMDGNGQNNHHTNLEWVTKRENMVHAFHGAPIGKGATSRLQPVWQILPNGTRVWYPYMGKASKDTQTNSCHISNVCRGQRNMAGGFRWEYAPKEPKADITPTHAAIQDDDPIWAELEFLNVAASLHPCICLKDDDPIWADLGL